MAEDQKLTEALAKLKKLEDRQHMSEAAGAVAEYFASITVPSMFSPLVEKISARVVSGTLPVTETGELDRKKIREAAQSEYNEELTVLKRINPSMVRNMGATPSQLTEAQVEKIQEREQKALLKASDRFASVMGFGGDEHKVGRKILREGRDGFDVHYNARTRGVAVSAELGSLGLEA